MSDERLSEEAIFEGALQLPIPDRPAYLVEACGNDADFRARVESLLAAHEDAGSFLETPAVEGNTLSMETTVDMAPVTEKPGEMVGRYKLLQKIGEGGMGVVYMADQESPVRRRVALKIIKPGMDSAQVIARFEAERQALAMMDHPNIAKVFDAGTTEYGRPYFVMELVQGVPITRYCDDKKLTPHQRLELFVQVCQAIQHAHQKGIIHRDLKPSNVLVAIFDGKPMPKVIDFGIAKALHQRLTEKTLFTQFGGMVGTPEYMSPEQTELDMLGTDTRSDIYTLGVLLYELLTGTTPLEIGKLREAGYEQMMRTIRELEPPKPSTRLSSCGDSLASISAFRGTEPRKLSKLLAGDLDWIVMKALEKDRTRRYETANGLARDVQRYLDNEPVEATPPSAVYRFRKLMRRHRRFAAVLLASIIFLVVLAVGSVIAAAVFRQQEQQQRRLADSNARLADEREAQRAQAEKSAERERVARNDASAAEARAVLSLADMYTLRGVDLDASRNALAPLWFAKAATLAGDDPKRVEANLIRVNNWLPGSWTPVAAVQQPGRAATLLSFDPTDARYLIAVAAEGAPDETCRIWDLYKEEVLRLPTSFERPTAASWTPDGRLLLGTRNGAVVLISVPDLRIMRQWEMEQSVTHLVTSRDGRLIAASAGKKLIVCTLGQTATPSDPATDEHPSNIAYIEFAPGSDRLVTASDDERARVFSVTTGSNGQPVIRQAFAPAPHIFIDPLGQSRRPVPPLFMDDGRVLVTVDKRGGSDADPAMLTWHDAVTGRQIAQRAPGTLSCMAVSPDGKMLAATAGGGFFYGIDGQRGRAVGGANVIAFNPRKPLAVKGGGDVRLYNINSGGSGSTLGFVNEKGLRDGAGFPVDFPGIQNPTGTVAVSFSAEGEFLAVSARDGAVRVWRLPSRQSAEPPGATLKYDGKGSWAAFTSDGRFVAPIGTMDGGPGVHSLQVYDAQADKFVGQRLELQGVLVSAAFSPDGRWIATATGFKTDKKELRVRDWRTGQESFPAYELPTEPGWVAYAPDGQAVAVHCLNGLVLLINAADGHLFLQCRADRDGTYTSNSGPGTIFFSQDGKSFFTLGSSTVQAWDRGTGRERYAMKLPGPCWALAQSPDGRVLATGSSGGALQFWEAADGHELRPAIPHPHDVFYVAFSVDGDQVVTCCKDSEVRIWDVRSGSLVHVLQGASPAGASAAAFTRNGRWIMTTAYHTDSGYGPRSRLWDAQTGFPVTPVFLATGGYHHEIDFSADGRWAAIGGSPDYAVIVDLGKLTSTAARTPQDALLWSEILSNSTVDNSETRSLTNAEWLDRWHRYRAQHPEFQPLQKE